MVANANTHSCQVYGRIEDVIQRAPVFARKGQLDHKSVGDCARSIADMLREKGSCDGVVRRAYSVVVELLENVLRHGQFDSADPNLPSVSLWRESEHSAVVVVSNLIPRDDVTALDEWLRHVKEMPRPKVKDAIRHAMLSPSRSLRGGAGIGLLSVRQLTQEIEWNFGFTETGADLFTIMVRVA